MADPDHGLAPLQAHPLSPLTKKSRSTVNSPIFACRSRTSASWSSRDRSAPFENTSRKPSTARCFQALTRFGWTLCRAAISWIVLSPRNASSDTFAFELPRVAPSRCHSVSLLLSVEYTLATCPIFRDHLSLKGLAFNHSNARLTSC